MFGLLYLCKRTMTLLLSVLIRKSDFVTLSLDCMSRMNACLKGDGGKKKMAFLTF